MRPYYFRYADYVSKRLKSQTWEPANLVTDILDHRGPKPMRNLRPANRTPTSADQFDEDHQSKYEDRKPSHDALYNVEHHNSLPKLKNELDKRRSIQTVKPIEGENIRDTAKQHKPSGRRPRKRPKRLQKKRVKRPPAPKNASKDKIQKAARHFDTSRSRYRCDMPEGVQIRGSVEEKQESVCSIGSISSREPAASSYHSMWSMEQEPML